MVGFRVRGEGGIMAELRNVLRKKNGGRGASSRGFVRRIGFFIFYFLGDATQVRRAPSHGVIEPLPSPLG